MRPFLYWASDVFSSQRRTRLGQWRGPWKRGSPSAQLLYQKNGKKKSDDVLASKLGRGLTCAAGFSDTSTNPTDVTTSTCCSGLEPPGWHCAPVHYRANANNLSFNINTDHLMSCNSSVFKFHFPAMVPVLG